MDNELIWFYYSLLENVIEADRGFQTMMMMEHYAFDEWMSERDMETILESYFRYLRAKQDNPMKEYINKNWVHWIKDDGMYSRMVWGYHVEVIGEEEYSKR